MIDDLLNPRQREVLRQIRIEQQQPEMLRVFPTKPEMVNLIERLVELAEEAWNG